MLKEEKPELFDKVKYCLHLPQYLSFLFTGEAYTDITSVGCHTNLWNFKKMKYHKWIKKEKIINKIPPVHYAEETIKIADRLDKFLIKAESEPSKITKEDKKLIKDFTKKTNKKMKMILNVLQMIY